MIRKLLGLVPDSFYGFLLKPSFRYSSHFRRLESLFTYSEKERVLKTAIEFAKHSKLDGDYLEFGVFEGDNVIAAYHLAQSFGLNSMRFYAFDSFQGLPAIEGVDEAGFQHFSAGEFVCDQTRFRKNLNSKGVDFTKVTVVPGWYNESLSEKTKQALPLKKAAIVYIDCDLYESTVPVLEFLTNVIQDGTIILFDDWFCFRGNPNRGEQRAFREWLDANRSISVSEFQKFSWQSNSFIIHMGTNGSFA